MTDTVDRSRRRLVLASLAAPGWPMLSGCATPLPPLPSTSSPEARALLAGSAAAHGLAALSALNDVNVSYAGDWHRLVARLQPTLVDAGFRGGSQEHLLLHDRIVAQTHTGPAGRKVVLRQTATSGAGDVRVWFNGRSASDAEQRAAAALVADGYCLFLLGPMLLQRDWAASRSAILGAPGSRRIVVNHRTYECDILSVQIRPGLGFSDADELALYIDREQRLMRRVRFTLNGLESTRGAVAEVDTDAHLELHGVAWPTRFHEHLRRPFPLAVHDWRLTGLDVNRGLSPADVEGDAFDAKASSDAGAPT